MGFRKIDSGSILVISIGFFHSLFLFADGFFKAEHRIGSDQVVSLGFCENLIEVSEHHPEITGRVIGMFFEKAHDIRLADIIDWHAPEKAAILFNPRPNRPNRAGFNTAFFIGFHPHIGPLRKVHIADQRDAFGLLAAVCFDFFFQFFLRGSVKVLAD